jgi:1-acyl-sn-glycerol-3-phosphate acyltransferase
MSDRPTVPAPALTPLDPFVRADALVSAIVDFLKDREAETVGAVRDSIAHEIDRAGEHAMTALGRRLATTGADWTYYGADPLARRLHHVIANHLLQADSCVSGVEHLAAVKERPLVMFANHLSYSDANLLEILLQRSGGQGLSDRLTVIAGPKVYSSVKRRFSALCFGTIKTPQSSARSSEEAVMNPREVARAARRCIDIAHDRLAAGDALLVFAEGTRSRTNQMQRTLPAAARYLEAPDVLVLPVGITGTETLFPIDADTVHPVRITIAIGAPLDAAALWTRCHGNRRAMMDTIGHDIARLLPPQYRGWYA